MGIVAEGRISEQLDSLKIMRAPTLNDTVLTEARKANAYSALMLHSFDKLIDNTQEIASFILSIDTMKSVIKTGRGKRRTHVRFCRKTDQNAFVRSFDARKYFTELIAESKDIDSFEQYPLSDFEGNNFYTYIKLATFRLIDKDDYQVSVLSNGMMIFSGMNNDLTYYCRDQALGASFQELIDHPIMKETVLSFDPRRAKAVHRSIQPQS